ncbi:MAG TPA: hypothetical protein VHZ55_22895 [Bryobacteraceae bacterium]|nr:hypothetical protein [Bryobacteraceae bacterium]
MVLAISLAASLFGIAVSLWAHLEALGGRDPDREVKEFWVFQLILFALLLPIVVEMFTRRDQAIFRSPRWMRNVLYFLLAYYGVNFYVFLYWTVDDLSSAGTWRMFSAGWLLLFGLAAAYYRVRWEELKRSRKITLEQLSNSGLDPSSLDPNG